MRYISLWEERDTNEKILRRKQKYTEVVNSVKIEKSEYFGHIMRHPEMFKVLDLIKQGEIN